MKDYEEALRELEIPADASPMRKLEACCQWCLGDPEWAGTFIEWAREAGMKVSGDE